MRSRRQLNKRYKIVVLYTIVMKNRAGLLMASNWTVLGLPEPFLVCVPSNFAANAKCNGVFMMEDDDGKRTTKHRNDDEKDN